jgi:hypothetical protein
MRLLKVIGRWIFTVLGLLWIVEGSSALINHGKDALTGNTVSMGGAWLNLTVGLLVSIWPIIGFFMFIRVVINRKPSEE